MLVVFDCVFYGCFPPVCLVSDVTASFVCLSQEGVPRVRIIFGAFPVGLDIYLFISVCLENVVFSLISHFL